MDHKQFMNIVREVLEIRIFWGEEMINERVIGEIIKTIILHNLLCTTPSDILRKNLAWPSKQIIVKKHCFLKSINRISKQDEVFL